MPRAGTGASSACTPRILRSTMSCRRSDGAMCLHSGPRRCKLLRVLWGTSRKSLPSDRHRVYANAPVQASNGSQSSEEYLSQGPGTRGAGPAGDRRAGQPARPRRHARFSGWDGPGPKKCQFTAGTIASGKAFRLHHATPPPPSRQPATTGPAYRIPVRSGTSTRQCEVTSALCRQIERRTPEG